MHQHGAIRAAGLMIGVDPWRGSGVAYGNHRRKVRFEYVVVNPRLTHLQLYDP
jgi:hypothetical protein